MSNIPLRGMAEIATRLSASHMHEQMDAHVHLPDGRTISIEMIDENEVAVIVDDYNQEGEREIVWSDFIEEMST